jgi:hypothetical protein
MKQRWRGWALAAVLAAVAPTCHGQGADAAAEPVFGTTVVVPSGLRGEIYFLKAGTDHLPNFDKMEPVGVQLIDNDELHLPVSRVCAVKLAGGIHKIRVAYFQGPCSGSNGESPAPQRLRILNSRRAFRCGRSPGARREL